MKIKYITFECVSECNMNCPFCFSGWRDELADAAVDTDKAKRIITRLWQAGVGAINFTGGEPLLRQDLPELLRHAKELGFVNILSTNGILLKEKLAEIAGYIDFVGLPLDSDNPDVHNSLRPASPCFDHYNLVLLLIDYINLNWPHIKIKINTVVTQQNASSVIGIGRMIAGKAVSWKLSHFAAQGFGERQRARFEISDKDYFEAAAMCRQAYPELNIIATPAHFRDKSCRVLSAIGHLLKPDVSGFEDLGDVLNDGNVQDGDFAGRYGLADDADFDWQMNAHFYKVTYPGRDARC